MYLEVYLPTASSQTNTEVYTNYLKNNIHPKLLFVR